MQIGKAARSNRSHIKSRLKMEPHGVFKEVTRQNSVPIKIIISQSPPTGDDETAVAHHLGQLTPTSVLGR